MDRHWSIELEGSGAEGAQGDPILAAHIIHPDDAVVPAVRHIDPARRISADSPRIIELSGATAQGAKCFPVRSREVVHAHDPIIVDISHEYGLIYRIGYGEAAGDRPDSQWSSHGGNGESDRARDSSSLPVHGKFASEIAGE